MRLRNPETDFTVPVEGIGTFTFGKRRMADEIQIQRGYAEIAGGVEPTVWLANMAEYLSTLRVLTVKAPDGWDIDNMDPLDEGTYDKIKRVYIALREREETFRGKSVKGREEGGQADGADRELLVPEQVPADQ